MFQILFSTPSKAASLFIPFFLLSAVMPSAKIQEPMYINANWEFVQQFGVATQLSDLVEMHNVLLPVGESKSDIRLVNKLKRVFTFFSVCSTRLKCHSFRDCCVDSPVSYLPVNCILVDALFIDEIIQNTDSVSKKFRRNVGVLAIDSCPLDTDKELVDQCRSSEHLVVSTMTNLVYRNRACATCCNDTDVIEFGTKLACVDDNLVNKSKSPMWERIIKGECVLVEVIPPGYKQMVTTCIKEPKRDAQITSRCNVTGLWKDYDETINWACEHLNFIVNDFKNVFCILCNPGLASTIQQPIIGHETCTYTLKDSFEHELANKCETAEQTPRWHPFKNIYCMICYDPWANQTVKMLANFGIEHFIHLEFNILEKIENMEKHLYQLIGMFESRQNAWTQYKRPNILELSPFISKIYGGINEMCGSVGLCKNVNQTIVTTNTRKCISCTCNPPCTDKHIPCCFDKLLQYDIYNCIEGDKFLTIRKGTYDRAKEKATFYRVIDRCPDYGLFDLVLDGKCMSTTDQLSNVPVHLQDQVTTYKNIYCLQCNENAVLQNERKNSMYNFKTYLKITCHSYIDERLIVSIDIVIFLAKSHDCTVQFTLQQSGQARVCPYVYAENILKYDCFDGKQWQAIRDENKLCTEHQILSIDFPSLIYNFALCIGMNCTRYVIMSCRNSDSNVLEKSTICSFSTADVISHTDGHNPLLPSFPGSTTFGYHDLFSISRQEIDKIRNLKKDPPTVCIQV
ncbi:hypothetical protein DPMN_106589 [Dreissena polymorpha]|uniref:Uncharacterized protein n=1 Tax=Dreissena polymorpha TaxID=45954 RepID=A0A9D4K596_DREPO|nr:hypothetical protein DPMN_106589 [Dreissena polymorpha]